jgi:hypothetical protein
MDAYSSLILRMAEDRIRDLRREAVRDSGRRWWFRRRPASENRAASPVAPRVEVIPQPDELRRTA